jgi:hypothetical protein
MIELLEKSGSEVRGLVRQEMQSGLSSIKNSLPEVAARSFGKCDNEEFQGYSYAQ